MLGIDALGKWAALVRWVKNLLFPVFCLRCGREGEWLCQLCESSCPATPIQRCIFCETIMAHGETCGSCQRRHSLDGLVVRGIYGSWVWRDLIHAWKYRGAKEIGLMDGRYLCQCLDLLPLTVKDWVVVPIPLARRRELDRGFNQSEVLAQAAGEYLQSPVRKLLVRTRETLPQSKLAPEERLKNVHDCFASADVSSVSGRHCLLVDDISTTGATLDAAASALKRAGAASVWGLALARSTPDIR